VTNLNESATIDIPCPKCQHKTTKSIGWLKANSQFTCECGVVVVLQHEELLEGLAEIDARIEALKQRFKWIQ